jgi:hypothetical protein
MMRAVGSWLFLMGFVAIGIISNIRKLLKTLGGSQGATNLALMYLLAQSIDTLLGLLMAWAVFGQWGGGRDTNTFG